MKRQTGISGTVGDGALRGAVRVPGLRSAGLTLALGILALLACTGSTALAAAGHPFIGSLPLPSLEPQPVAVAVASGNGNVFVGDTSEGVVDVFNASGAYLTQFGNGILENDRNGQTSINGIAIDNGGSVYVADAQTRTVDVFRPDGFGGYSLLAEWRGGSTAPRGFTGLTGVAVDNSTSGSDPRAGDVYVVDATANAIYVFKPPPAAEDGTEGTLVGTLKATPKLEQEPAKANAVSVSAATGTVYVANGIRHLIEVFNSSGELERTIVGKTTPSKVFADLSGVAVEEPGEDVYAADREHGVVDQFNPVGEWTGRTSAADTNAALKPQGVAVDNSSGASKGQMYVVDGAAQAVDLYGPTVTVPLVATGKATGFERAAGTGMISGTLSGTINPEGEATYHFEYRETGGTAPFVSTPVEPISGTSPTEVHAAVKLAPATAYEFRLVGASKSHEGARSYGLTATSKPTPPAVTGVLTGETPTGVTSSGATLTGSLSPQGIETTYRFEYGETIGYGASTPTTTTSSTKPVAVEQAITGLTSGRTYHFRIAATNEFGTTYGDDHSFTTTSAGAPLILSESGVIQTPSSATLSAKIDPAGEPASYRFEYGESATYGQTTPEAEVPVSGSVSAELNGLKPATTYHFRAVAKNGKGETEGADVTFTTSTPTAEPGPTLPDKRAYELVTPPNKSGAYVEPATAGGSLIQASEDGNSLAYIVLGSLVESPEGNRSPESQQVLSTRGPASWTSQELVTPSERPREVRGQEQEYLAFSGDLSLGLLQPQPESFTPLAEPPLTPPLSEAERGHQEKTVYLRADPPLTPATSEIASYEQARHNGEQLAAEHGETTSRPGYLALVTRANTTPTTKYGGKQERRGVVTRFLSVAGATSDLSHVVLKSKRSLTSQPGDLGLFEWTAGTLQLISVLPSGQPAGVDPTGEAASDLGSGKPHETANSVRHAISNDGSRIVWSLSPTSDGGKAGLFLRDTNRGETIQLDKPAPGVAPTEAEAIFQIASADGSKVFFTAPKPLTADAKAGVFGAVEKSDLYECEIVEEAGKLACKLTDLTAPSTTAEGATVQGVIGASEDGAYVYIHAKGVLAPGGQPGAENLYVLHQEGASWRTSFIATVSGEDFPDWAPSERIHVVDTERQSARISPNGRYFAFMSNRRLTGYNNTDLNEEGGPHADEEVFLYDAVEAGLTCASCNPTGARPLGVLDVENAGEGLGLLVDGVAIWAPGHLGTTDHWLAGSLPGATPVSDFMSFRQPRYLSDTGRLFFNSADALVPEAAGRTRPETIIPGQPPAAVGVENVYQYEPSGVGSCSTATGCVALISSGTSGRESALLDASTSGNDVFFLTDAKLLPQDTDVSFDIYDARVCSESSPCQVPPTPPPAGCASTEECRGGGAAPETFQPPLTSGFSGPGNTTHLLAAGGTLPAKSTKPAPLTKAQKLARALKACRKLAHKTHSQKVKRSRCESQARKLYGPTHKSSKKKK
jgi:hypothetical protein